MQPISAGGDPRSPVPPGVAIVSLCSPGVCDAAWTGVRMAASHTRVFSALLLSHHPMLQRHQFWSARGSRVAIRTISFAAAANTLCAFLPQPLGAVCAPIFSGGQAGCPRTPAVLWRRDLSRPFLHAATTFHSPGKYDEAHTAGARGGDYGC